ncbi:MAG: hypothetical protein ACI8W7_002716 [Gammaproteobacteria bacterium]|jgi:hypothetical protein
MTHLGRDDLMGLETYAEKRAEFRTAVMAHKKKRKLSLGSNATLYFEDRMTVQYQIQEMLRAERIFERAGIDEELQAYNPLIPDGSNLKATFMLEYPDATERAAALGQLIGIEDRVWIAVADHARVYAIADEDLERENEVKTSAVHFLRFEFDEPMLKALKAGAALAAGIDHTNYVAEIVCLEAAVRSALLADFA